MSRVGVLELYWYDIILSHFVPLSLFPLFAMYKSFLVETAM